MLTLMCVVVAVLIAEQSACLVFVDMPGGLITFPVMCGCNCSSSVSVCLFSLVGCRWLIGTSFT